MIKSTIIFVLFVFLFACASSARRTSQLHESVSLYNLAVRWNKNEMAKRYVDPSKQNEFVSFLSDRDAIILEYEIKSVKPLPKKGIATVDVEYKWRPKNSIIVKTSIIRQLWRLSDNVWYIFSQKEIKKKKKEEKKKEKLF